MGMTATNPMTANKRIVDRSKAPKAERTCSPLISWPIRPTSRMTSNNTDRKKIPLISVSRFCTHPCSRCHTLVTPTVKLPLYYPDVGVKRNGHPSTVASLVMPTYGHFFQYSKKLAHPRDGNQFFTFI